MTARLVIHPPDENGWRRVRYDGVAIGVAYKPSDVVAFLEAAGMQDPETFDLTDPALVEWRGGGPETWAESPP
ncbi:hypothetical protein LG634_06445 [Streptomyces bambusae]|uniref:hypothetical protein n=1 Tax=Streptomyces bambusae TaxID=1550616 RepID=UPI001CFEBD6A|nr:hypothetical protein [Streptomyces bambusae]MCB5164475.1 hypothetical protein [Streptomyces bambusae]